MIINIQLIDIIEIVYVILVTLLVTIASVDTHFLCIKQQHTKKK